MAVKKKSVSSIPLSSRKIVLHRSLEKPVHNLIGYSILLILAIVTLAIIFSIQHSA